MNKNIEMTTPRYQQIAIDIASKIVSGHYQEGDKIYARSALSSQYSVSSETARRAISILSDIGIVETLRGSGVVIKSQEKAIKFVKQYDNIKTVNDLKNEVLSSIERQAKENNYLKERVNELVDRIDRFKAIDPFAPFKITINSSCSFIGKTIAETNFWHNTIATIVAIGRDGSLMISPGPYAVFKEGDIIYFVGDENSLERVNCYLYP